MGVKGENGDPGPASRAGIAGRAVSARGTSAEGELSAIVIQNALEALSAARPEPGLARLPPGLG